nr:MAG TPA: hypothetical protein [Caudoviricetes sp.]
MYVSVPSTFCPTGTMLSRARRLNSPSGVAMTIAVAGFAYTAAVTAPLGRYPGGIVPIVICVNGLMGEATPTPSMCTTTSFPKCSAQICP